MNTLWMKNTLSVDEWLLHAMLAFEITDGAHTITGWENMPPMQNTITHRIPCRARVVSAKTYHAVLNRVQKWHRHQLVVVAGNERKFYITFKKVSKHNE